MIAIDESHIKLQLTNQSLFFIVIAHQMKLYFVGDAERLPKGMAIPLSALAFEFAISQINRMHLVTKLC